MRKFALFLISYFLFVGALSATNYYCSPTGNGDGTAYNRPTTFATGLTLLNSPGDTLYLLGGQYDLLTTTINLVGSSRKNIVISGYPGEKAILDFRQTAYGKRGLQFATGCQYVHLKDMTLRYSGKNNIINYGSYNTFENLDIYGSADTGCQMKTGGNNLIKNCDSHDNFDYENGGTSAADFGGNADGFADKQHSGEPNHYIGCRAWHNGDDGWDFFARVTASETVIENCICYDNGPAEYDMRNHPRYQVDRDWFDQIVGQTVTNRYGVQQTVSLEHYPCHGNGNGFKLGGQYTSHLVLIHHCLSVANGANGFDHNNDAGTMRVYNNTGLWNKNMNFGFGTGTGTLSIQNCVSYLSANADTHAAQTTTVDSYNSWNNMPATASDFQSLDTTQILAARQSNGELAVGTLMRLATGSQYIDAGVNLGFAYNGSAPDMGCYESDGTYHPGTDPDPEPTPDPTPSQDSTKVGRRVAFVTVPEQESDDAMLSALYAADSLVITVVNANQSGNDYSNYDLVILGPKPSSTAAGIAELKTVEKPMLILKPFVFKSTVWNWGTPQNTAQTTLTVTDSMHPIFQQLSLDNNNQLTVFSQCNTNALTCVSAWTSITPTVEYSTAPLTLATVPYTSTGGWGQSSTTTDCPCIAEFAVGANCNGTVLKEKRLMLGISEYSTANLTTAGTTLLTNACYYLLGMTIPAQTTSISIAPRYHLVTKYISQGRLLIQKDNHIYDAYGRCLQ